MQQMPINIPLTDKISGLVHALWRRYFDDVLNLSSIPVASNNATAAAAGVKVGGLYRTNADPSYVCVRTV
jgi:hypothetical protein